MKMQPKRLNKLNLKKLLVISWLLGAVLSSCKHDVEKQVNWETGILMPLLKDEIDISNLIPDSVISTSSDNSLQIVYRNTIYSLNISDIIQIPDTTLEYNLTLDSLKLSDRTIVRTISMGNIATQMGGVLGAMIIASHNKYAVIPPLSGITSSILIDATEYFETMTLQEGYMDIIAENGLPIDITNAEFELENIMGSTTIFQDSFSIIPAGGTRIRTIPLAGETVEGEMRFRITNMESPGSIPDSVFIDTSDALVVTIIIRDLKVFSATAIFPAQDILNSPQDIVYGMNGAELTFFEIKSGVLNVDAISTIQDSLYFFFSVPKATDPFGNKLETNTVCPPAPPGGSTTVSETHMLDNYEVDLTGENNDTFNLFKSNIIGRIDSTGRMVSISLSDSIYVYYGLVDIIPDYITGYFDSTLIKAVETASFDLFKNIKGGTIELKKVGINVTVENGIGVDGKIRINSLEALNSYNGNAIALSGTVVGKDYPIIRAKDNPYVSSITTIPMNSSNSNAKSLIENMPSKLNYDIEVFINPNGFTGMRNDFAYYDSKIDVNLDIDIPLTLIASKLLLVDTLGFDMNANETIDRVTGGTIKMIVDNGFPLEADLQIYLYNARWMLVDSIFVNTRVKEGILDRNCMVTKKARTNLYTPVNQSRIQQLKKAIKAVVLVEFTSTEKKCNSEWVKIYSNYNLDVKLIGDFDYIMRQ